MYIAITDKWTRLNLQDLKIRIDETNFQDTSPVDIVKMIIPSNRPNEYSTFRKKLSILDDFVHQMSDAIEGTITYQLLDYSFDSLSKERGIIDWFATRSDMWNISSNFEDDDKIMTDFKNMYQTAGEEFTDRLFYCIDNKDEGEIITEHMFQHLFVGFLQLFGIRCHYVPFFPTKASMDIDGRVVTGEADVSIKQFSYNRKEQGSVMDWKTLLVCEVTKQLRRNEEPPSKRTRTSSHDDILLISDKLLGQHGAELLLNYPSSVNKDHILGLIVEQTHITFVVLSITEKQYQQLIDGYIKYDTENGPKMLLSKSYDYLILSDRKCLTKAFLTIGYLQRYGSDFFTR